MNNVAACLVHSLRHNQPAQAHAHILPILYSLKLCFQFSKQTQDFDSKDQDLSHHTQTHLLPQPTAKIPNRNMYLFYKLRRIMLIPEI